MADEVKQVELPPITVAVDMDTTNRLAAEAEEYLASLSPERRAELEGEWA